jgi:hypothetical protein
MGKSFAKCYSDHTDIVEKTKGGSADRDKSKEVHHEGKPASPQASSHQTSYALGVSTTILVEICRELEG